MRILLTGSGGQLGEAFLDAASADHDVVPTYRTPPPERKDARAIRVEDAESVRRAVAATRPDWVVHAAAFTNVDGCERDPALARAVNALGTRHVAHAAAEAGARVAYVSTDYVFDGEKGNYVESDATRPLSAYGRTKLEGEVLAREAQPDLLIARTSVVYSPHRRNFVSWLIGSLQARKPLRIVEDQRVSPTLAHDLARMMLALMEADAGGVYHAAGATPMSRFEMATRIARAFQLDASLIAPAKSTDLSWIAQRPMDSTLDVGKISKHAKPLAFEDALQHYRGRLEARRR